VTPVFFFNRSTLTKTSRSFEISVTNYLRHSIISQNILIFSPIAVSIGAPRIFVEDGGWHTIYSYNLCPSLKTMLRKTCHSSSRHTRKMKTNGKRKTLHVRKLLLYFSIFQCTSHQLISVADLG